MLVPPFSSSLPPLSQPYRRFESLHPPTEPLPTFPPKRLSPPSFHIYHPHRQPPKSQSPHTPIHAHTCAHLIIPTLILLTSYTAAPLPTSLSPLPKLACIPPHHLPNVYIPHPLPPLQVVTNGPFRSILLTRVERSLVHGQRLSAWSECRVIRYLVRGCGVSRRLLGGGSRWSRRTPSPREVKWTLNPESYPEGGGKKLRCRCALSNENDGEAPIQSVRVGVQKEGRKGGMFDPG